MATTTLANDTPAASLCDRTPRLVPVAHRVGKIDGTRSSTDEETEGNSHTLSELTDPPIAGKSLIPQPRRVGEHLLRNQQVTRSSRAAGSIHISYSANNFQPVTRPTVGTRISSSLGTGNAVTTLFGRLPTDRMCRNGREVHGCLDGLLMRHQQAQEGLVAYL